MSDPHLVNIIRIAVTLAGHYDRGTQKLDKDDILSDMDRFDIPHDRYSDVYDLMDAFFGFAQSVRAAERKKRPIVRVSGEDLPGEQ